ncbi:hypothetical protein [Microcoleus sp. bin38.metabat.b11b12b14.051]|uniref:hypothetical protein n=1 Tax=Microcoleus sp. bin38.metabat.b11b12b14.051 TaxID=2742709 RepID=UPI0025F3F6F6|nr:hypothetical protein [Microcoleus sp. bin38.metabat.b11b12b14.051]
MTFSNAQWGAQFENATIGAAFSALGTAVSPIQILSDALQAFNKSEANWNKAATAPPYLNSVSGPNSGQVILTAEGLPSSVPISYTVSLVQRYAPTSVTPRTSTVII